MAGRAVAHPATTRLAGSAERLDRDHHTGFHGDVHPRGAEVHRDRQLLAVTLDDPQRPAETFGDLGRFGLVVELLVEAGVFLVDLNQTLTQRFQVAVDERAEVAGGLGRDLSVFDAGEEFLKLAELTPFDQDIRVIGTVTLLEGIFLDNQHGVLLPLGGVL